MNRQLKMAVDSFVCLFYVYTFMPKGKRNESGAYQGAKYFLYNGKILNDIRQEMEREGHGIHEK